MPSKLSGVPLGFERKSSLCSRFTRHEFQLLFIHLFIYFTTTVNSNNPSSFSSEGDYKGANLNRLWVCGVYNDCNAGCCVNDKVAVVVREY